MLWPVLHMASSCWPRCPLHPCPLAAGLGLDKRYDPRCQALPCSQLEQAGQLVEEHCLHLYAH